MGPKEFSTSAAWVDYDKDGKLDLVVGNYVQWSIEGDLYCTLDGKSKSYCTPESYKGASIRLWHNRGDGTFEDVTQKAGLGDPTSKTLGIAILDYDNDGWPDLLLSNDTQPNKLYRNNGNGTFTEKAVAAGVAFSEDGVARAGMGVDAADYDHSGAPSILITNFSNQMLSLYHNEGRGLFVDEAPRSEIGRASLLTLGFGCFFFDYDLDGWPDIFIANDGKPNHLWVNQHDGTFKEEALLRGVAVNALGRAEAGMGIGWGDVDGDGLQDLFLTHLGSETNTLWRQGPRGQFSDRTAASGMASLAHRSTGFGAALADFDHDGALDAVMVNGRVFKGPAIGGQEVGPFWSQYAELNQVLVNDGKGHFNDLSPYNGGSAGFSGRAGVGRGLAVGDIHNSGALGVLTTGIADRARLYRNLVSGRGNWLQLRAYDPALHRDALGAEITVRAGERRWVRTVHAAGSYLSSSDPRAHFGLGALDRFDSIEVLWPDGKPETSKEVFPGGPANRHLTLERDKGKPAP